MNIYLYGAGGHAKVIRDIIEDNNLTVSGIIDDNPDLAQWMGLPVLRANDLPKDASTIITIGSNLIRKEIATKLIAEGIGFAAAVSTKSIISSNATIGEGTVIMQGSILQSSCSIGRHCIINTGASVDHDCVIGDYAHISPHATLCGNVHVGEGTWIGAGATIIPGIKIGKWAVIGAGSVVLRDIPDGVKAYGNPCRVIGNI